MAPHARPVVRVILVGLIATLGSGARFNCKGSAKQSAALERAIARELPRAPPPHSPPPHAPTETASPEAKLVEKGIEQGLSAAFDPRGTWSLPDGGSFTIR